MKDFLERIIFYFIHIVFTGLITSLLIKRFNDSIFKAYQIIFLLLIVLILFGILISRIIFIFRINNKKIKKLNHNNFETKNLFKSIIISILTLFVLFSSIYIFFYSNNSYILGILDFDFGIINSMTYISKIFLLSLPLYAFEITFLEYCNFMKQIHNTIIYKTSKSIIWILLSIILSYFFNLNGFLYSKIITDIIFFIYNTINLKKIIQLCQK